MGLPTFSFDWLEPATETHDRKLPPGRTTSMVNTRRTEQGAIEKRLGFDRSEVETFVGGSYLGPATALNPSGIVKDTGNQLWLKQGTTAYHRGYDRTVFPTFVEGDTVLSGTTKPVSVLRNGKLWEFTIGVSGVVGAYQLRVTDVATDVVVREEKHNTGTIYAATALVDPGGTIRLFYCSNNTGVFCESFTSETTGPTSTTVHTESGAKFTALDSLVIDGTVYVAATSFATGGGNHTMGRLIATLDTGTGLAASTDFATDTAPDSHVECCNGVGILTSDGADGFVYVSYWRTHLSSDTYVQLVVDQISTASLSTFTQCLLDGDSSGSADLFVGVSGGWVEDETVYTLSSLRSDASGPPTDDQVKLRTLVDFDQSTLDGRIIALSATLASHPFKVGDSWFYLSSYDSGSNSRNQRDFFVRDVPATGDSNTWTPVLDGLGVPVYFAPLIPTSTGAVFLQEYSGHNTRVSVDGTKAHVGLTHQGATPDQPVPCRATLDWAPVLHSSAPGILAGGIVKYVTASDQAFEVSPLIPPHVAPVIINGAGPGIYSTNRCTYRYVFQDAKGDRYPSSPFPVPVTFTFLDSGSDTYSLFLPSNRHVASDTECWIEVFGSIDGENELHLQTRVKNDPTATAVAVSVAPLSWDADGEILDVVSGAQAGVLDQAPLPQSRLAHVHADRLWLAGTSSDEIWYSQRRQHGSGWVFNEVLVAEWHEGSGGVQAIGSLNADTLVLFKRDAIGTVTGPGPDGLGNNGYTVQTAPTSKDGCSNPYSVCQTPIGLLFQRAADNRLCLFNGAVVALPGQEAYLSYLVTGVAHDSTNQVVNIHCSNGKVLQLQLRNATAEQPYGVLVECTSEALVAAPAIAVAGINGTPIALEAGDETTLATWSPGTGFTDDDAEILMDFTTVRMAPAGFMGEFDVDNVWLSSTHLGGDSEYRYTLTSDWAAETHDDDVSTSPDVSFRANAAYHTREVKLRILETSATGRGRQFDGCTIEYLPVAPIKKPRRKVA
jgi:hypothetical protein